MLTIHSPACLKRITGTCARASSTSRMRSMANRMKHIARPVALAATTAAGLLMTLTATSSATAATESPAPECVESFQSWRYTDVHNGCSDAVSVTVEYTNGQWAPCRVIEPGGWATF